MEWWASRVLLLVRVLTTQVLTAQLFSRVLVRVLIPVRVRITQVLSEWWASLLLMYTNTCTPIQFVCVECILNRSCISSATLADYSSFFKDFDRAVVDWHSLHCLTLISV